MEIADEDALRALIQTWTDEAVILRGQALKRRLEDGSILSQEWEEYVLLRKEWGKRKAN